MTDVSNTDEPTKDEPTNPGTRRPEGRSLDARAARLDLGEEAAALRQTRSYAEEGHTAKTLVKRPDQRVVLLVLEEGSRLKEHETDHGITVQALSGRIRLHVSGDTIELAPGQLLALEASVPHDVEALDAAAALLTLGWSAG